MAPTDLQARFGDRYKVTFEQSFFSERPTLRASEAVWLQTIPAKYGHFYPAGPDRIGFATDANGPVAGRLRRLPFVTVTQDGDDGVNVEFPAGRFADVAAIVKPKRRRRLSAEHKRKLAEAGRKYRFRPGLQSGSTALERPPAPRPVSYAVPSPAQRF